MIQGVSDDFEVVYIMCPILEKKLIISAIAPKIADQTLLVASFIHCLLMLGQVCLGYDADE
jgi:hypothetical protein